MEKGKNQGNASQSSGDVLRYNLGQIIENPDLVNDSNTNPMLVQLLHQVGPYLSDQGELPPAADLENMYDQMIRDQSS